MQVIKLFLSPKGLLLAKNTWLSTHTYNTGGLSPPWHLQGGPEVMSPSLLGLYLLHYSSSYLFNHFGFLLQPSDSSGNNMKTVSVKSKKVSKCIFEVFLWPKEERLMTWGASCHILAGIWQKAAKIFLMGYYN